MRSTEIKINRDVNLSMRNGAIINTIEGVLGGNLVEKGEVEE